MMSATPVIKGKGVVAVVPGQVPGKQQQLSIHLMKEQVAPEPHLKVVLILHRSVDVAELGSCPLNKRRPCRKHREKKHEKERPLHVFALHEAEKGDQDGKRKT